MRGYGNTVVVIEHDRNTILNADWLVDIGPEAGRNGGKLLFMGPVTKLLAPHAAESPAALSRTRSFLSGQERIKRPLHRRTGNGRQLQVLGAAQFNLKQINVSFALGVLNVVTGVSGAGKSTLVHQILGRALKKHLQQGTETPGKHKTIVGIDYINKVIEIDQSPIGKTPRSNPATYSKVFDRIRNLFAELPESKFNNWSKGRFSFNVKGGRCESCQGAGVRQIGMHFLGQVDVICEECGGKRFNPDTLKIRYRNHSIAEILDMPIAEAKSFFPDHPNIHHILAVMDALGLGYISLGQPSTTLSGGEAQRVKLAAELARPATGKTLYILDEPTTGLHPADIKMLLSALDQLVNQGNTVILIEHDPEVIKTADHIIDLGPDSGPAGGRLVATGTPEEIAAVTSSYTGQALQANMAGKPLTINKSPASRPDKLNIPIRFSGVTTNNLKHIEVSIPINNMTVITGVSGSGKSSLVFDTIFAESRDRFTSSLSTYARTFIAKTKKAQFEHCSGLCPAIAVGQTFTAHNPRSTVGTLTGIFDYIRLLFSRFGNYSSDRDKLSARDFSFNHESGACSNCNGLGNLKVCDPKKLITNPELSLALGAMAGTKTGRFYSDPAARYIQVLHQAGKELGYDLTLPWQDLPPAAQKLVMYGSGERIFEVDWQYKRKNRSGTFRFSTTWQGMAVLVHEEYQRKHADKRGRALEPLLKNTLCPVCHGARLKPAALQVRLAEYNIATLCSQPITTLLNIFENMASHPQQFLSQPNCPDIFLDLIREIHRRLSYLRDLGLPYLSIDRATATLSGGEARRVRLAGQLGAELRGVAYVLDEPTIGLHVRDIHRLLKMLSKLRDLGNTVIVVEHDAEVIKNSDYIIDLGPGAGKKGGNIVAQGCINDIATSNSQTIQYIQQPNTIPVPKARRRVKQGITISQATANNLQGFDIQIPSQGIIAVSGVSGSGKSSLIFDLLASSAESGTTKGCSLITGFELFSKIISIDQSPVGLSPASSPVTLIGVFAAIRTLFADSAAGRKLGYSKSRFSYNNQSGRCETCRGMGAVRTAMDFLSDVWTDCEECKGRRYNQETLACKLSDRSIADVLDMTIIQAMDFFSQAKTVFQPLAVLDNVGLGYLKLGQAANTLSGGEAQRIKLASELIQSSQGSRLYLFDEPTTGLHFADIKQLVELFHKLADQGHTLIICEHHPDVLKNADWLIDLGPEGGDEGGRIIAADTPENICAVEGSYTGQALKPYLSQ